jgi:hypothetical protein
VEEEAMERLLELARHRAMSGIEVVTARGDITMSTSGRFHDVLDAAMTSALGDGLVVDLCGVRLMHNTGMAALLAAGKRGPVMVRAGGPLRQMLRIARIDAVLTVTGPPGPADAGSAGTPAQ